jgi:YD repeat-containing protein
LEGERAHLNGVEKCRYDPNGNMASRSGQALTYDAENRLVTHGATAYAYNGDGARVKRVMSGTTSPNQFGV